MAERKFKTLLVVVFCWLVSPPANLKGLFNPCLSTVKRYFTAVATNSRTLSPMNLLLIPGRAAAALDPRTREPSAFFCGVIIAFFCLFLGELLTLAVLPLGVELGVLKLKKFVSAF